MTTIYEIPLTPQPQTFLVSLRGVQYRMTLRYAATIEGGWVLDIADAQSTPIVSGIPLVTGANLLEQYAHLNIGVPLYVATDGNLDAVPTFDNLGVQSHLYLTTS